MKSQLITVLSIIGVLGTAGTAVAVNSNAFSAVDQGSLGGATEVLTPASSDTLLEPSSTPTASPSPSDIPDAVEPAAPAAPAVPAAPAAPAAPTTQHTYTDDGGHDDSHETEHDTEYDD
jgi:hypothetical protein